METIIKRNTDDLPEDPVAILDTAKEYKLSDAEQTKIVKEIMEEFKEIKKERDAEGLDEFFDSMDNQYNGKMPRRKNAMFNLNDPMTKRIVDDINGSNIDALFSTDPILTIKPRPEFGKANGWEVCEKQEEFVDSRLDEKIPLKSELELASLSAILKGLGLIKWFHCIKRERRVGKETYIGKNEMVGQDEQGQPIIQNQGIMDYVLIHGEDIQENPTKHKKNLEDLQAEKTITIDVEKDEIVYNDPKPKFIDNKNFYVRMKTNGYDGLCEARLIVERVNYTYYELKKLEKENNFVNVDELVKDDDGKTRQGAYSEDFDVLECVFYFAKDSGKEYDKVVVWIAEEKEKYLGSINYPYAVLDAYYVPHYVKKIGTGFYQGSIGEDIQDLNIASNAILNLALEDAYLSNLLSMTPIVDENSAVAKQFMNKSWTPGMPLYSSSPIEFMSKNMKSPDIGSLLALKSELTRMSDEASGSSSLRTGRESQLDPKAPGNKTIALLQETRKNIRRYVMQFSQGFNQDINCLLKIYHEITQDDQKYLPRNATQTVGENPFKSISRGEMIARTTIQSQAHAFDFDKLNERATDLALYQTMQNEMLIQGNPESKYNLIKTLIKGWSPKWKNQIDKILPDMAEFKAQQAKLAMQATAQYFGQVVEQSKITGQPPQLDPEQLLAMIQDLQSRATSTVEAEVERQKQSQQEG